jgi:4-aminobutyrate aminotransferase-like enzyme
LKQTNTSLLSQNAAQAKKALLQRRARLLGPAYRHFYTDPVHVVRGNGVFLYDKEGREYLDAYNNVVPLGHGNRDVAEAIARQMATLCTHTRYLQDGILDYAEDLVGTFGGEIARDGHIMLTCTGSEANDLALRLARAATGADSVIITQHAYHGNSLSTAALSPSLGKSFLRSDWVRLVPAPDSYRAVSPEETVHNFTNYIESQIKDIERSGRKLAALLIDSFFTSDGVFSDPVTLLAEATRAVRGAGGLVVMDEVQTGFGRTGNALWGYQRYGIEPDIVTLGKPMGNGYPVAGLATTAKVAREFGENTRYFNTFGGNTVSVAAAQATLRGIREQHLQDNARTVGHVFKAALKALQAKYECIGDVRGEGLYLAVELITGSAQKSPASALASAIVNGLRERGVLISVTGMHANSLKIRPPLIFSYNNIDRFMSALTETLDTILRSTRRI